MWNLECRVKSELKTIARIGWVPRCWDLRSMGALRDGNNSGDLMSSLKTRWLRSPFERVYGYICVVLARATEYPASPMVRTQAYVSSDAVIAESNLQQCQNTFSKTKKQFFLKKNAMWKQFWLWNRKTPPSNRCPIFLRTSSAHPGTNSFGRLLVLPIFNKFRHWILHI